MKSPPPPPTKITKIIQCKIFQKKIVYQKRVYYFIFSGFFLDTSNKGLTLFFWKYHYYNASVNIETALIKLNFCASGDPHSLNMHEKDKNKKKIRIENIKNRPQQSTLCWFNVILSLNFIFFCFKLIIIHYNARLVNFTSILVAKNYI